MRHLYNLFAQLNRNDINIPSPELTQSGTIETALRIVFGLAGAIAAIIITIGAFKYVVSLGDPASTAKAKNTIIYALIGLVICVGAYSLVSFIAGKL